MRTAISPGQWQPWTAVSALLGLSGMAWSSGSYRTREAYFKLPFTAEAGALKEAFDKKAEFQSLFSFSEHEFYFVFRGLFHCCSRVLYDPTLTSPLSFLHTGAESLWICRFRRVFWYWLLLLLCRYQLTHRRSVKKNWFRSALIFTKDTSQKTHLTTSTAHEWRWINKLSKLQASRKNFAQILNRKESEQERLLSKEMGTHSNSITWFVYYSIIVVVVVVNVFFLHIFFCILYQVCY